MANMIDKGHSDIIVPMKVTASTGLTFLLKEFINGRLKVRPDIIFLDSSHEYEETMLELHIAFQLLADGGILCGDDFSKKWIAVRHAVRDFGKLGLGSIANYTKKWEHRIQGMSFDEEISYVTYYEEGEQWIIQKTKLPE